MDSVLITLLAFLVGGGGSDLLDYLSPAEFWKNKGVVVSVESMSAELKPTPAADVSEPLEDLNSPDPQVREDASAKLLQTGPPALTSLREAAQSPSPQVAATAKKLVVKIEGMNRAATIRRLMAIRALGDPAYKEAAPLLEPLLKSEEPFVADYARESIERINSRPVHHAHAANLRDDVYLLPDGCRMVGQIMAPAGDSISLTDVLGRAKLAADQDRATVSEGILHMLVASAENIGNVRVDALSFGISGDVGERSGYVVAIAHGSYESRAMIDWLHQEKMPSNFLAGVEIFQPPGAEAALCFPSDHYAVFVASPLGTSMPTKAVIEAIKGHIMKLKLVVEMKKLIDATSADEPMWAVAQVTPAYAVAPVLAPFDTVRLDSRQEANGVHATISATGAQPDKAKVAADITNRGAKQVADDSEQREKSLPDLKILSDIFKTAHCEAEGGNARLTASIDQPDSGLFLLPLLMRSTAATNHAASQPAVPGR
jgi:hypothetical protein